MSDEEREAMRLARELGGGWRGRVIPNVVLTVTEAQKLEQRLTNDMPRADPKMGSGEEKDNGEA